MAVIAVVLAFMFVLALSAGIYALVAFLLEFCWNNVMPAIFHLPEIGWFQAFCLLMVAHMLIKTKVDVNQKKD